MKSTYYLPETLLTNADLVALYPEWTEEKILSKTGVGYRHVVSESETALSLAERAAKILFRDGCVNSKDVDYLLLCTQSPEYTLPSTACLLHERLCLRKDAGDLAFDHGCSGYIYGLSLAKGLIVGGMSRNVLLVTSETYTKYIAEDEKSTRTIFGDGAAATQIDEKSAAKIGAFSFGTDDSGADKLIVHDGKLFMDGPEIFNFTLDVVPRTMIEYWCSERGC